MNDSAADRQIVLITGASRGIGRFLAEHFLAGDFAVIGLSRSAISTIDAPNYTHFEADIADEKAIVRTFAKIRETFGRLDIAINNAAIHKTTRMLMTSYADAKTAFDVNVIGTLIVSREAAKLMMRRRWGRIICFSSMGVRHEPVGASVYAASKAAVTTLTRVMAKEFFPYGITCNVVAPAAVDTEMMAEVDPSAVQDLLSRNAIPTIGSRDDVGNVIDWLIRRESQSITGQVIYLGGA
jgi:3-oxoacyl-[acyl-carrier protein] reductase